MKISGFGSPYAPVNRPAFTGQNKRKSQEYLLPTEGGDASDSFTVRPAKRVAIDIPRLYQSPEIQSAIEQLQQGVPLSQDTITRLKNRRDNTLKQLVQDMHNHHPEQEWEKLFSQLKQQLYAQGKRGEYAAFRLNIYRLPAELQENIFRHKLDQHPEIWQNTWNDIFSPDSRIGLTKGQFRNMHLLTQHGVSLNGTTKTGGTVLHDALRGKNKPLFDYFMQFHPTKLPLNQLDHVDLSPLDVAVMKGNDVVVNALLNKGACITKETLKQAALWGEPEILEKLLKQSNLDLTDEQLAKYRSRAQSQRTAIQEWKPDRNLALNLYSELLLDYLASNTDEGQLSREELKETKMDFVALAKAGIPIDENDFGLGEDDFGSGWNALHQAALMGHKSMLRTLLRAGADVSKPTTDGDDRTALHLAAAGGYGDLVKMLLKAGAHVDDKDASGKTPLHEAAQEGHADIFHELHRMGGKLNDPDHVGDNLLHHAARSGNTEIVKTLLENGASLNEPGECGYTPLSYAAERGHLPVVEQLLASDPKKIKVNGRYGRADAPLSLAVTGGHLDVFNRLVKAGASLKVRNNAGETLLHRAVEMNNPQFVERLLELKVPVNLASNDGSTPLHMAAQRGNVRLIKRLIRAGAKVDQTDNYGRPAIYDAVTWDRPNAIMALLRAGADVDCWERKKDGSSTIETPLHCAAAHGNLAMVNLLLENGADVCLGDTLVHAACNEDPAVMKRLLETDAPRDRKDSYGRNALHKAAAYGNLPVLQLLLNSGFSVKELDAHQGTALHWAAENGSVETVKALLEAGVPVEQVNDQGETALIQALKSNHSNVPIRRLVNAGVPLNAKDNDGHTAMYYAYNRRDRRSREILQDLNADFE